MKKWKEVAKFFAGLTAWEAMAHASLLLSGSTPAIFGFTLTPTINTIQVVVPAIVSVALAYYAWIKK